MSKGLDVLLTKGARRDVNVLVEILFKQGVFIFNVSGRGVVQRR